MRTMNRFEQPFRGATTLQEQINRVFGDVVGRAGEESNLTPWAPAVDIYETEHELVGKADVALKEDEDAHAALLLLLQRGEELQLGVGKFGPLADLQQAADVRLATLHSQGMNQAQLYGRDDKVYGGLNAFFLLMDKPETYGLPNADNAKLPSRNDLGGYVGAAITAALAVVGGLVAFRRRVTG